MKQGEESAAVDKNQAQPRQRRADFFGHRKRFCEAHTLKPALMLLQNPRRISPSFNLKGVGSADTDFIL
jgi:hypothetical protein